MGCCRKFIQVLVWFSIVFDFGSDWAQFIELSVTEEHKKVGKEIWYALLAFCIWGTLTFIAEIIIMVKKRRHMWIIDFIALYTEDIPQIVLTAILAYHLSEVGSVVQVVKASATCLEMVIKFAIGCCKSCQEKDDIYSYDEDSSCRKVTKLMTFIGYGLTVLGALLTLCFAMITIDENGEWHFHKP